MERVKASFYLIMYMLFISLPLLVYLGYMYKLNFRLAMEVVFNFGGGKVLEAFGAWDFRVIFGAFFIKLPIYLFHI